MVPRMRRCSRAGTRKPNPSGSGSSRGLQPEVDHRHRHDVNGPQRSGDAGIDRLEKLGGHARRRGQHHPPGGGGAAAPVHAPPAVLGPQGDRRGAGQRIGAQRLGQGIGQGLEPVLHRAQPRRSGPGVRPSQGPHRRGPGCGATAPCGGGAETLRGRSASRCPRRTPRSASRRAASRWPRRPRCRRPKWPSDSSTPSAPRLLNGSSITRAFDHGGSSPDIMKRGGEAGRSRSRPRTKIARRSPVADAPRSLSPIPSAVASRLTEPSRSRKPFGPSSRTKPSRRRERICPPSRSAASSSSTGAPWLRSAQATVNPEMPPPMTTVREAVTRPLFALPEGSLSMR